MYPVIVVISVVNKILEATLSMVHIPKLPQTFKFKMCKYMLTEEKINITFLSKLR